MCPPSASGDGADIQKNVGSIEINGVLVKKDGMHVKNNGAHVDKNGAYVEKTNLCNFPTPLYAEEEGVDVLGAENEVEKSYNNGFSRGYKKGYKKGARGGYRHGYFHGFEDGYEEGYKKKKKFIEEVAAAIKRDIVEKNAMEEQVAAVKPVANGNAHVDEVEPVEKESQDLGSKSYVNKANKTEKRTLSTWKSRWQKLSQKIISVDEGSKKSTIGDDELL